MSLIIAPQPGAQTRFLQCSTDVALYGGAAGSAKSYSLLLESLRHAGNPHHRAMIFRRTSPMLRSPGSIYQVAKELFTQLNATCNDSRMEFRFRSGGTISFSHMQTEDHRLAHQGAQYSFVGFDEATQFSDSQVNYLLSRLRNQSITPYARLTCNPDSTSWLKEWVIPFLDSAGQYPIESECGKTWYIGFGGENGKPIFNRERSERTPLSFTFIPGKLTDNSILLESNPRYVDMLQSLPIVERQQLLFGDWSISYAAGSVFQKTWFRMTDMPIPSGSFALGFDLAATPVSSKNRDPDYSAS